MTYKSAEIIRVNRGTLSVGAPSDISIFDTKKEWTVDPRTLESKGKNCVFTGKKLIGKAVHVIVGGDVKMKDEVMH